MTDLELVELAIKAREKSYSPYSHFAVGAALEANDGQIFLGCNIENAGYTPANCAERTAFFKAVSEGVYGFKKIAVVGGAWDAKKSLDDANETCADDGNGTCIDDGNGTCIDDANETCADDGNGTCIDDANGICIDDGRDLGVCAPCGVCRQVMMEFCQPDSFEILLGTRTAGKVDYEKYKLKELLPLGFGPLDLGLPVKE